MGFIVLSHKTDVSRSCVMGGHATREKALCDGPSNSFAEGYAFEFKSKLMIRKAGYPSLWM